MRVGPLEVVLEYFEHTVRYSVEDTRTGETKTYGYRPTENAAKQAGWDDAVLIRQFVR